jgi:hypothetical protein
VPKVSDTERSLVQIQHRPQHYPWSHGIFTQLVSISHNIRTRFEPVKNALSAYASERLSFSECRRVPPESSMNRATDHHDEPARPATPGHGAPRPPYTPSGFIEASRRFARAAAEGYSPGDAPFFFLHAGAAVELLLKAALCAASPALLIDGGKATTIHSSA